MGHHDTEQVHHPPKFSFPFAVTSSLYPSLWVSLICFLSLQFCLFQNGIKWNHAGCSFCI